jgi:hypothetical protein
VTLDVFRETCEQRDARFVSKTNTQMFPLPRIFYKFFAETRPPALVPIEEFEEEIL